eukprot:3212555-Amphidinium_carterae.1
MENSRLSKGDPKQIVRNLPDMFSGQRFHGDDCCEPLEINPEPPLLLYLGMLKWRLAPVTVWFCCNYSLHWQSRMSEVQNYWDT